MQNIVNGTNFLFLNLSFKNIYSYIFALAFISGNIILPQLVHSIPRGGLIFLPIYFFTLIAAYKFGIKVGIFTAVLSPLVNHLLFGMPPSFVLPYILIKSNLLAFFAALVSSKFNTLKIHLIALVVLLYQLIGSILEGILTKSFTNAVQDATLGLPGILIQVFLGYLCLFLLSKYDIEKLG